MTPISQDNHLTAGVWAACRWMYQFQTCLILVEVVPIWDSIRSDILSSDKVSLTAEVRSLNDSFNHNYPAANVYRERYSSHFIQELLGRRAQLATSQWNVGFRNSSVKRTKVASDSHNFRGGKEICSSWTRQYSIPRTYPFSSEFALPI